MPCEIDSPQTCFPRSSCQIPLGGPTIPRAASCVQHPREARSTAPVFVQVRSRTCCRAALTARALPRGGGSSSGEVLADSGGCPLGVANAKYRLFGLSILSAARRCTMLLAAQRACWHPYLLQRESVRGGDRQSDSSILQLLTPPRSAVVLQLRSHTADVAGR